MAARSRAGPPSPTSASPPARTSSPASAGSSPAPGGGPPRGVAPGRAVDAGMGGRIPGGGGVANGQGEVRISPPPLGSIQRRFKIGALPASPPADGYGQFVFLDRGARHAYVIAGGQYGS